MGKLKISVLILLAVIFAPLSASAQFGGKQCPPGYKIWTSQMYRFAKCNPVEGLMLVQVQGGNKCIDNGGSKKTSAKPHSWSCNRENSNQLFKIMDKGRSTNGNKYIQFEFYISKLCLDIPNFSMKNDAMIQQSRCTGASNQIWEIIEKDKKGWFNLRAKHSKKCMGIRGMNHNDGAKFIQWTCDKKSPDQRFSFMTLQAFDL